MDSHAEKTLTEEEEKNLRSFFSFDDPSILTTPNTAYLSMNTISSKIIFDKKYPRSVCVPPHAITIMWYFENTSIDFMGSFTPDGITTNLARAESVISAKEQEKNEKQSALDAATTAVTSANKAVTSAKGNDKNNLRTLMNNAISSQFKMKREFTTIDNQVKTLQSRLTRFKESYEEPITENMLLKRYIDNNSLKLSAIKEHFAEFMNNVDKANPFYCFITLCLRGAHSKSIPLGIDHNNGLLFVKTPGDPIMKIIRIEPEGYIDKASNDEIDDIKERLRKSILAISTQILGSYKEVNHKWISVKKRPPQYYTKDRECIFWTKYIVDKIIGNINQSYKDSSIEVIVDNTINELTKPEILPTLGSEIQRYKTDIVIPTIPTIAQNILPDIATIDQIDEENLITKVILKAYKVALRFRKEGGRRRPNKQKTRARKQRVSRMKTKSRRR